MSRERNSEASGDDILDGALDLGEAAESGDLDKMDEIANDLKQRGAY